MDLRQLIRTSTEWALLVRFAHPDPATPSNRPDTT
jgi:hypothetical protein